MHRVELKAFHVWKVFYRSFNVPNAPCGVERLYGYPIGDYLNPFLMHRVELKGLKALLKNTCAIALFLMHRVELKVILQLGCHILSDLGS